MRYLGRRSFLNISALLPHQQPLLMNRNVRTAVQPVRSDPRRTQRSKRDDECRVPILPPSVSIHLGRRRTNLSHKIHHRQHEPINLKHLSVLDSLLGRLDPLILELRKSTREVEEDVRRLTNDFVPMLERRRSERLRVRLCSNISTNQLVGRGRTCEILRRCLRRMV